MRDNQSLTVSIYKFLNFRFKKLERRLELLLYKDSKERVIGFIDDLKNDYGYSCPHTGNIIVKHPYTQKDIASLIGTSRPTLNIIMNQLKASGGLVFERNQFIFKKNTSVLAS